MAIFQYPAGKRSPILSPICVPRRRIQLSKLIAGTLSSQFALASLLALGQSSAAVKSISCKYVTYLGTGSLPCSVNLTAAAGTSGLTVTLTSNNSEAKPPASVKVTAGAGSAAFSLLMATGLTTETATLTAKGGGGTATYSIKLWGDQYEIGVDSMGLNALAIPFGDATVNSPATQSLVVKSVGKDALTVTAATVTGSGFSLKGATLPVTLAPGSDVTWDLEFDPTSAGSHTGTLNIISNSLYRGTAIVSLSGTGETGSYEVRLSWTAPSGTSQQIAGYRIYRANSGSSSYKLLNSSLDSATSYADSTVQNGVTYDYYVETVNSGGVSSAPSTVLAMSVP